MILKRNIGEILVWLGAFLPVGLWLLTPDEPLGRRGADALFAADVGQLAGLVGMAMLAIAFVLASRVRWIEDLFGGLDKMYQVHHRLGRAAFVMLLAHPIAHALRFVPHRLDKALLFLLPTHQQSAVNLGAYAFWLFVVLMILTLFVAIAYDKWKVSHKFLGLVLLLGTVHMALVTKTPGRTVAVTTNPALLYYMLGLAALAACAFLYSLIVRPLLARRNIYAVNNVRRLGERVLEVELLPKKGGITFSPGQFVFVTFDQRNLPREAHPFTICSLPERDAIVLTIKALGDFTRSLYRHLRKGAKAWVEGPYGRFDYRSGSADQIWLAAGVGIAPFLSWARDLARREDGSQRASLYYCVRSRGDAVQYEEFQRIAIHASTLSVALICSEEQGHLRATDLGELRDKDIFMCGPKRFTFDLRAQFRSLGVPVERIHFEDFEFR
jgi:predicted ferric reductase